MIHDIMHSWRGFARFSVDKSKRQQERSLRDLVRDAYRNVPALKKRFDRARLHPLSIRTFEDLTRLPVADRTALDLSDLRAHLRRGTDPKRCVVSTTSGTTGQQFAVYMSRAEAFYRRLTLLRAFRRNVKLRLPFSIADVGTGSRTDGYESSYGMARITRISRLLPADEQINRLMAANPDIITGIPSCLDLLVERMLQTGCTLRPRLVVCRGETMQPHMRSLFTMAFDCRVVDYYNCEEIGNVAWECPADPETLHVQRDTCYMEIVDAGGFPVEPGSTGRVVVTNLFNRTMPFLRHALGDLATAKAKIGRCTCGYRGPSLWPIDGREYNFFRSLEGKRISPRVLSTTLNESMKKLQAETETQVHRYQVVQESSGRLRVSIATPCDIPQTIAQEIASSLETLKLGTDVRVERTDRIPNDPNGKFRRFIAQQPSEPPHRPGS